jgi:hypothetical protein
MGNFQKQKFQIQKRQQFKAPFFHFRGAWGFFESTYFLRLLRRHIQAARNEQKELNSPFLHFRGEFSGISKSKNFKFQKDSGSKSPIFPFSWGMGLFRKHLFPEIASPTCTYFIQAARNEPERVKFPIFPFSWGMGLFSGDWGIQLSLGQRTFAK